MCQVHNHTLYRTTSVVENGPFYSVSQQVRRKLEMLEGGREGKGDTIYMSTREEKVK